MDISWSRGDGNLCLVTCRKSNSKQANPNNGWFYFSDNRFAYGNDVGDSNFCVFSGIDTFISVRNLEENSSYIFQVFEFDYNPYIYLSSDAPWKLDSTYWFSATTETKVLDSCKSRNGVQLKALTKANFPVTSCKWHFDFNDFQGSDIKARMEKSGLNPFTLTALPNMGCKEQVQKGSVYIIPGADSAIIHSDTVVCTGENELFHSTIYFGSVPRTGYTRTWLFENGLKANTLQLYRTHQAAGNYTLMLIVNSMYEDKYTGCSDTFLRKYSVIKSTPLSLGKDTCFEKGNLIILSAPFVAAAYKWDILGKTRNYFVTDTGYHFLTIRDFRGCHSTDTIHIGYCKPTSSINKLDANSFQLWASEGSLQWRNASADNYPIQVLQANGKLVATLIDTYGKEGVFQIPSGIYFIRSGTTTTTKIWVP